MRLLELRIGLEGWLRALVGMIVPIECSVSSFSGMLRRRACRHQDSVCSGRYLTFDLFVFVCA